MVFMLSGRGSRTRRDLKKLDSERQGTSQTRMATNKKPGNWRARTIAVRGGQTRTAFQETSEALFLTSGYAYESPEQAEGRFTGEDEGFQYTRFSNPTISMFEDRMAALEGAPVARATASGMAAVSAALLSGLNAGDH